MTTSQGEPILQLVPAAVIDDQGRASAGYEYIGGNWVRTVYSEAHYARFAQMILNGGQLEDGAISALAHSNT